MTPSALIDIEARAAEVADMLKLLANKSRLLVLCTLAERGTASVGDLAQAVGLSQSALSQHLARLREDGLVMFERDGQTLWYRLRDLRISALLETLHRLYCANEAEPVA